MTVILVPYSMENVTGYADRLIVMNHGQKVFGNTPKEVFHHYKELEAIDPVAPQITYLAHDLRVQGIDIDGDITTVEEAKETILGRWNRNLTESGRGRNV